MSEYESNRARLMLRSLEKVKERLGMREISCDVRYLTCDARVSSLGEAISRNKRCFEMTIPAGHRESQTLKALSKAVSLKTSLEEAQFTFLRETAQKHIPDSEINAIERARELVRRGDTAQLSAMDADITSALTHLSEAVTKSHSVLSGVEREVIKETALRSLKDMGYESKIMDKGKELLIRGVRQDLSIAMKVTANSELHIDMAGFSGGVCTRELENLHNTLKSNGIECEVIGRNHHGKKEGGILIQEAAQEEVLANNPLESNEIHTRRLLNLNTLKQKIRC